MGEQKRGVIVYLREGSVGVGHKDRNRPAQDGEDHEEARRRESEWREIGLGAQILKDLGISSIKLLASRERHYVGLEGFGIEIVRTEISVTALPAFEEERSDRGFRPQPSARIRRISSIAASRCGSLPAA